MRSLRVSSPWLTAEGAALAVLGVGALIFPILAGVALALVLGWALVFVGAFGVVSAFGAREMAHFGLSLLSAVIALLIGGLILVRPMAGVAGLSFLIGLYLLLDGGVLCALSSSLRRQGARGWGWLLASGILDLLLAALIVALPAAGSAALLGVIIGIDLIAAGAGLMLANRPFSPDGSPRPA